MTINKKTILYDISNLAYIIADTGDYLNHPLHQVRDICEQGNIDRVSRILGLAYADILAILSPILDPPDFDIAKDVSKSPHNYVINFKNNLQWKFSLTTEKKLKIKATCHEFMVAWVLTDWLSITLPVAADVWKAKMERARETLEESVASITATHSFSFRRPLSPF